MKTFKSIALIITLCAAAALAPSCKKNDSKQEAGGKQAAQSKKAPAAPKKTLDQLLKEIPCDLAQKPGIFAVFPKNPVQGQWCFNLVASIGKSATFDIQSDDMSIVVHQANDIDPNAIKLVQWKKQNDTVCMDPGCATPVETDIQTFEDPKSKGMIFVFMTPKQPVILSKNPDVYYGVQIDVQGEKKAYIPMFN